MTERRKGDRRYAASMDIPKLFKASVEAQNPSLTGYLLILGCSLLVVAGVTSVALIIVSGN